MVQNLLGSFDALLVRGGVGRGVSCSPSEISYPTVTVHSVPLDFRGVAYCPGQPSSFPSFPSVDCANGKPVLPSVPGRPRRAGIRRFQPIFPGTTEKSLLHAVDYEWRNPQTLLDNSQSDMIPLAGPGPAYGAACRIRRGGGSPRGSFTCPAGRASRVASDGRLDRSSRLKRAFTRPAAVARREFPHGTH